MDPKPLSGGFLESPPHILDFYDVGLAECPRQDL